MTIFRGPGGTGSASSDSDTTEFQEFLVQSQAARDAAQAAQVAAEAAADDVDVGVAASAASASAAATQATNAANSATSAAVSATNAAATVSVVSASAAAAASSATGAAGSATSASTSATSAATQATNAAASASSASGFAGTATTQATNAANNATASSNSASSSANSATASAASATDSAGYATAASSSATNAANSATAAASSASSAASSAASAAAALDSFDDRYLGAKTANPTLDNDGNALVQGALYYRSTAPIGMKVYDGAQWIEASAAQQASLFTFEYVATAGQTTFTGNDANGVSLSYTVGNVLVSVNGVRLRPGDDFTASTGTSIVLASAAAVGDEVLVDAFKTFDVANTYTQAQVDAALAGKQASNANLTDLATNGSGAGNNQYVKRDSSARIPIGSTWSVYESSGVVYFAVSGVTKAKLDGSGNLTVVGNVTAYGTV